MFSLGMPHCPPPPCSALRKGLCDPDTQCHPAQGALGVTCRPQSDTRALHSLGPRGQQPPELLLPEPSACGTWAQATRTPQEEEPARDLSGPQSPASVFIKCPGTCPANLCPFPGPSYSSNQPARTLAQRPSPCQGGWAMPGATGPYVETGEAWGWGLSPTCRVRRELGGQLSP
ncbi:unnamed protein product [Eretmochelys imbricata]